MCVCFRCVSGDQSIRSVLRQLCTQVPMGAKIWVNFVCGQIAEAVFKMVDGLNIWRRLILAKN